MTKPDPNRARRFGEDRFGEEMLREVGVKQSRMLKARAEKDSFWSSMGVLGVVGWSVVLPTLLGIGLGVFLDRRWPGRISWTITLLFAGLMLGCVNAWIQLRGYRR